MAIPAYCDPENRTLPEGDPDRYVPEACGAYLGRGTYRVAEAFRYNREYSVGEVVELTDEEAGIFHRWIDHADPAVAAAREAAARVIAENTKPLPPSDPWWWRQ